MAAKQSETELRTSLKESQDLIQAMNVSNKNAMKDTIYPSIHPSIHPPIHLSVIYFQRDMKYHHDSKSQSYIKRCIQRNVAPTILTSLSLPSFFLPIPTNSQKLTMLISYWLILPVFLLTNEQIRVFLHSLFFLLEVQYTVDTLCNFLFYYFCLTIYPGNLSISVCRDFPYSCFQLHIMQYSIVWMYHSISSYCSKYGHLNCLFYPATTVLQ